MYFILFLNKWVNKNTSACGAQNPAQALFKTAKFPEATDVSLMD